MNSKERKIDLCKKVWELAVSELLLEFRFLDLVTGRIDFKEDEKSKLFGIDGTTIYYEPSNFLDYALNGQEYVNRAYLHMIFHGLFYHIFYKEESPNWNLSCDIAVEYVLDYFMKLPITQEKRDFYQELENEGLSITAQSIVSYLDKTEFDFERLEKIFKVDDHTIWKRNSNESTGKGNLITMQQTWQSLAVRLKKRKESKKPTIGKKSGNLTESLAVEKKKRQDYRKYLEQFMYSKEDVVLDLDSFDYIPYMYGLELYKNMPLIEPLEYKEVTRLEELAIAIDTSGSCSGKLVKMFLEETWSILRQKDSFFKKFNLHIIQCDCSIQEDKLITSKEDMEYYIKHLTVKGFGGTNFCPVFTYIEELKQKGQFKKLKGLLYFTDGYGTFPNKRPDFEVAFIVPEEDYADVHLPFWAKRITISRRFFNEH